MDLCLDPGAELFQIDGFKLLVCHGPLHWWQLEDRAQDGSQGTVTGKGLVVEDQVLQFAFFDGHQDHAMDGIYGSDDLFRAPFQLQRFGGTGPHADSATQADALIDLDLFNALSICHIPTDGINGAGLHALSTSYAGGLVVSGDICRGVNGLQRTILPGGHQKLATAATAVADEIHSLPHILSALHQVAFIGLMQQVQAFRYVHFTGKASFDQ